MVSNMALSSSSPLCRAFSLCSVPSPPTPRAVSGVTCAPLPHLFLYIDALQPHNVRATHLDDHRKRDSLLKGSVLVVETAFVVFEFEHRLCIPFSTQRAVAA